MNLHIDEWWRVWDIKPSGARYKVGYVPATDERKKMLYDKDGKIISGNIRVTTKYGRKLMEAE